MKEKIEKIIEEKINPLLASHYGGAVLTDYSDGVVTIKLTGACGTCPSAQYTIDELVKTTLMDEIEEVKDVVLDLSVSDDLLDMAKKILNKEVKL